MLYSQSCDNGLNSSFMRTNMMYCLKLFRRHDRFFSRCFELSKLGICSRDPSFTKRTECMDVSVNLAAENGASGGCIRRPFHHNVKNANVLKEDKITSSAFSVFPM
jgi:hypothetical protein